jgi:hypothetical protein
MNLTVPLIQKNMKAIISRTYGNEETRSTMFVMEGEQKLFECKTIELPNLNNQSKISCIPEGVYDVEKILSPAHGKCFLIKNVVNRSAVEIHIGNYAAGKKVDTLGCILPGMRFTDMNADGFLDVAESTTAMNMLLKILPDKFKLYIL